MVLLSFISNFLNYTTYSLKIEVFYNSVSGKYGARCIPMNDQDNIMEFEYIEASNDQNRWRYIVCGVDAINNKAYMLEHNYVRSCKVSTWDTLLAMDKTNSHMSHCHKKNNN